MRYLTKNKKWEIDKEYNIDKILYLLIDRPDRSVKNGNLIWDNKKGFSHRNYNLPSYVWGFYYVMWYKNGNHIKEEK